jgi:hypothetical protein
MIELAIPKVTKAAQIRKYVAANPKVKSAEIAKAVGVKPAYVATVMWNAKKKAKVAKATKKVKKEDWATIALASSGIPFYKDSVTDTTSRRMEQFVLELEEQKSDSVNHPAHYKVGGIETIDFIEAKKLNYNIGNVVKYLTRADHKGNRKQDLEKALWYLERELSTMS